MGSFFRNNARWLSAGALLTLLSSFGQTFFISIFAGEIRTEFGLSHSAWGGAYTLGTGLSALAMLAAGGLTDRFRSRTLGAFVLAGLAAACLAMALNPVAALLPAVIFALRFTGQGMSSHIAMVSMSRWFVATRGRALAIATLGFAAGEALLPLSFVALMAHFDWRWLWVLAACIPLAAIPVLLVLLRTERTPQSHASEPGSPGMDARHWRRAEVWRHWLFWAMVPALMGPPAFNTAFFFNQVHYAGVKGWDHIGLVALFPAYTAAAVCAMLTGGWLLDRIGTARVIVWHQVPFVAAFALFALAPSLGLAGLGLLLMAVAQGLFTTLPAAFWAEFYGTRHLGSIKAMAAALMVLASAIGPGVTGLALDAGIGIETQYALMAGLFGLSTALMLATVPRAARRLG